MHAPPPVRVSVGGDRVWRIAVALIGAIAATNVAAWALAAIEAAPGAQAAAAAVAGLAGGAVGAWQARQRDVAGELAWDGGTWQWARSGTEALEGEAEVAIDLDAWMLLRFRGGMRGTHWLPLSRRDHVSEWSPLRSALYWPRPTAPDPR